MDVHFSIQDLGYIAGKQAHGLPVTRFGYAYGEDPGIIKQIQIVLHHVILKLFLVQGAIGDSPDKGMGMAGRP